MTVVDPVDLKDFETCTAHKLVKLLEDLPGYSFLEVLGHGTCLHYHSQKVQVVSLLDHEFVGSGVLLSFDEVVRSLVHLC